MEMQLEVLWGETLNQTMTSKQELLKQEQTFLVLGTNSNTNIANASNSILLYKSKTCKKETMTDTLHVFIKTHGANGGAIG